MTTQRTVAVVVPVYNGATYMDQALGSIAAQRRRPDEIIVVDDHSTDGSAEVAERWAGVLPVRVLRSTGERGVWASRNLAIESTDAELIALLDVDDVWLPDHLAVMLDAYEAHPGLVTANAMMWIEGVALGTRGWSYRRPIPPVADQLPALLLDNYVFIGTLFPRELSRELGGFRLFTVGCEDWDLWLRMVATGVEVTRPDVPTMLYRLRGDSMSANDSLIESTIEVLEAFRAEHDRPDLSDVIATAIRQRTAKAHLHESYRAAAEGRSLAARRAAMRAFRGATRDGRIAAVAMALSPHRAHARRVALRQTATRAVHR